jgi:hypothetical protein
MQRGGEGAWLLYSSSITVPGTVVQRSDIHLDLTGLSTNHNLQRFVMEIIRNKFPMFKEAWRYWTPIDGRQI